MSEAVNKIKLDVLFALIDVRQSAAVNELVQKQLTEEIRSASFQLRYILCTCYK